MTPGQSVEVAFASPSGVSWLPGIFERELPPYPGESFRRLLVRFYDGHSGVAAAPSAVRVPVSGIREVA